MENSGLLNAWTKQETLKLIEEYKKHPILYIPDHPDQIKPNKKREAFLAIVESLKWLKPNVTESLVKTKLKTLRHQLASEKKKIICAQKNGMGATSHCKPTLWCYDELSFLMHVNDEHQASSTRLNNLQIFNDSQFDEQTRDESEHFIKPKKVREETEMETFQMTINKSMEIMEKISTAKITSKEEAFCQYLSTELTALRLEESFDEFKMSAMILLQNVKTKEKKVLSDNNSVWRDYSSYPAASASIPVSYKYHNSSVSSSAHSESVHAQCSRRRRRRSSSAGSTLDETIRSSSNEFGGYDDEFPVMLSNETDVKCEPEENY